MQNLVNKIDHAMYIPVIWLFSEPNQIGKQIIVKQFAVLRLKECPILVWISLLFSNQSKSR